MNFDLVVFDLDGTLVDSAPDLRLAVNRVLAAHGAQALELAQIRRMIGDGAAQLLARAFAARALTMPDPKAVLQQFFTAYQTDPTANTRLYEGVSETLEAAHRRGIPMAVCTNKPEALARIILDRLRVGAYFRDVVGGDTHPFRKPDARMISELLPRFAARPERTLMVGDSEIDAATAQAAAVPFVLMTYGYRRGPVQDIACLAALERFSKLAALIGTAPAAAPV
ncbi:MAG: HAD-IA family hydrolase [Proteobacteria bacterium]|nr:HAD-IA family hydrolase [Pseudomonadota bacterium]